ncbi:hypothetical protein [Marinactinospora rubrisoli]|uniref:Uncharacterized protein n=1 Tax=Marinactinospora rubrisoli TaxID=2715399 RepID=A0ABW2KBK6_9ACTN
MLTVGALRDHLAGLADTTPVVVEVASSGWRIRVEDVRVTTAQDSTVGGDPHEGLEVQVFWEPEASGWRVADATRSLFTLDDVADLVAERDAARRGPDAPRADQTGRSSGGR